MPAGMLRVYDRLTPPPPVAINPHHLYRANRESGGTQALLRERNSIANSERELDSVLGQAFSIQKTLDNQRQMFDGITHKMKSVAGTPTHDSLPRLHPPACAELSEAHFGLQSASR
jgi:hypothetical protein